MKFSITSVIAIVLFSIFSTSCNDDESVNYADYYPLYEGKKWTYKFEALDHQDSSLVADSSAFFKVKGKVEIEGKEYYKIPDSYALYQAVRREGSKYFSRLYLGYSGYSDEVMILNSTLNVNESWSYLSKDQAYKTVYTIKAKGVRKNINSKEYNNVIEVAVNSYYLDGNAFILSQSSFHWYAPNVGEIYSLNSLRASLYPIGIEKLTLIE
jgi:hypothetical protein